MPTIVDSLIVTLGLDASQFDKGRKAAAEAWLKTRDAAAKNNKEMQTASQATADLISRLRGQVLLLFAAFTGGRGVSQFADQMNRLNVSVGRAAFFLGSAARDVATWQGLSQATGGSVDGVTGSIQSLNRSLQQLSLTGESSIIPYLRALQAFAPSVDLSLQGTNGHIKTAIELLPQLHQAFQGMEKSRAEAIGAGLGLGQDLMYVLLQDDATFHKMMEDERKWGVQTESQIKASRALLYSWTGVERSFQTLWRIIMEKLTPAFVRVNEVITDFFTYMQKHPMALEATFAALVAGAATFAAILAGPAIAAVVAGLGAIGTAIGVSAGVVAAIIVAIAAAIAAGVLLYDDFKVWSEGGQAQFGALWQYMTDKWNSWKDVLQPIFRAVSDTFMDTIHIIKDGVDLVWNLLTGSSDDIRKSWHALTDDMGKWWRDMWTVIGKAILEAGPRILASVQRVFGEAFDWAIERANVIWNAITGHNLINKTAPQDAGQAGTAVGGAVGSGAVAAIASSAGYVDEKQRNKDVQALVDMGWTKEQATGVIANLARESGGRTNAVGDNGHAYGLAQWHEDRQANFKKVFGHDIRESTRMEQLMFVDWELHNTEAAAGRNLTLTSNEKDAAVVFSKQYERPKDADVEAQIRGAIAMNMLKQAQRNDTPIVTGSPPVSGAGVAAAGTADGLITQHSDNSQSNTVHVGKVEVHTQATDGQGVADALKPALDANSYVNNANYGNL